MKYHVSISSDLSSQNLDELIAKIGSDVDKTKQGQIFYHLPGIVMDSSDWVRKNLRNFISAVLSIRRSCNTPVDLLCEYDRYLVDAAESVLSTLDTGVRELFVTHIRNILSFITEFILRKPYMKVLRSMDIEDVEKYERLNTWDFLLTEHYQFHLSLFLED